MIITHETTIEEYNAWLATNPDFTAFKVAVRSTFKAIYLTIGRVKRLVRKVKNRSCLAPKIGETIYPLSYDKNGGFTPTKFRNWIREISHELDRTTEHIRLLNLFDCLEDIPCVRSLYNHRHDIISKVEDQIAMEEGTVAALEILNKK
ncbi:hypothetical protein [Mucilaginibacter lappiensis]|uniref:Uncharacterized protein n=1 Tax=Mucilaginibacter lappiensis TaxID=354630 RepID=A0A841JNE2_9SPHI|nr:hypothetical protein [Mucilaginibacter lappiensis]MBB6131792.1 hypothetical protein [Mucilaginibacter lappiensis]